MAGARGVCKPPVCRRRRGGEGGSSNARAWSGFGGQTDSCHIAHLLGGPRGRGGRAAPAAAGARRAFARGGHLSPGERRCRARRDVRRTRVPGGRARQQAGRASARTYVASASGNPRAPSRARRAARGARRAAAPSRRGGRVAPPRGSRESRPRTAAPPTSSQALTAIIILPRRPRPMGKTRAAAWGRRPPPLPPRRCAGPPADRARARPPICPRGARAARGWGGRPPARRRGRGRGCWPAYFSIDTAHHQQWQAAAARPARWPAPAPCARHGRNRRRRRPLAAAAGEQRQLGCQGARQAEGSQEKARCFPAFWSVAPRRDAPLPYPARQPSRRLGRATTSKQSN